MEKYISLLHNHTNCSVWMRLKEENKIDLVPHILSWLPKDHWLEKTLNNEKIIPISYTDQALIWGIAPSQPFQVRIGWNVFIIQSKDIVVNMKKFNFQILDKEIIDSKVAANRWEYRMSIIKNL